MAGRGEPAGLAGEGAEGFESPVVRANEQEAAFWVTQLKGCEAERLALLFAADLSGKGSWRDSLICWGFEMGGLEKVELEWGGLTTESQKPENSREDGCEREKGC